MSDWRDTYKGKTVLVTGHTGFKGSWLSIWLTHLGAKVIGYSLDVHTNVDNFVLSHIGEDIVDLRGDIRDYNHLRQVFEQYQPEYVFHLAAQPLVRESYLDPVYTYEVNLNGTINVLECIRSSNSCKYGIMITTDKVYENKETMTAYKEEDHLGGYDPYSSSKAACEIAISSWRRSYFNPNNYENHQKAIASVRAGNVIGGGDWSKDRIVVDCILSIQNKQDIILRNPNAIRPWQHVLEALYGYLLLGAKLTKDPIQYAMAYNFGPNQDSIKTVLDLATQIKKELNDEIRIDIVADAHKHEANILMLDHSKATNILKWKPILTLEDSVHLTCDWYKKYKNTDVRDLCIQQINKYCELIDHETD